MSKPLLCVTVTAPTMAELRLRRDEAAIAGADIVELRLDSVADPDVPGALAGRRGPVIVTCRPTWEGGAFSGSEEERRRILADALSLGPSTSTSNARARFDDLVSRAGGRRIVLSYHDFDGHARRSAGARADDAPHRRGSRQGRRQGPDACATASRCWISGRARVGQTGLVLIGMGDFGLATRVLPGRFGSAWTYAGDRQQVGQVSAAMLAERIPIPIADAGDRSSTGLRACPSPTRCRRPCTTPRLPRPASMPSICRCRPSSADDFVAFGRAFGVKGASVTIAAQGAARPSASTKFDGRGRRNRRHQHASGERRALGRRATRTSTGFLHPLRDADVTAGTPGRRFSAGAARRARSPWRCHRAAATSRVHARHGDRQRKSQAAHPPTAGAYPPGARQLGSARQLPRRSGMYPNVDETPIAAADLSGGLVYDLVYNPPGTRLLRDAAAAGCDTIGGLDMLVGQAQEQFEWWTGVRPAAGVMQRGRVAASGGVHTR